MKCISIVHDKYELLLDQEDGKRLQFKYRTNVTTKVFPFF